jgi:hypothetical protein
MPVKFQESNKAMKLRFEICQAIGKETLTMVQISERTGHTVSSMRFGMKVLQELGYVKNGKTVLSGNNNKTHTFKLTNKKYKLRDVEVRPNYQNIEKPPAPALPSHIKVHTSNDNHWTATTRTRRNAWKGSSLSVYLP